MQTETNVIYPLDNTLDTENALKNITSEILTKLENRFGHEYEIKSTELEASATEWMHEITIRKGNKIGVELTLTWNKKSGESVIISVDESAKLGSQITKIVLYGFILVGAYMGYENIPPFDFLPGRKIAAAVAGLICAIPALIVIAILKNILFKEEKAINTELANEVKTLLQN